MLIQGFFMASLADSEWGGACAAMSPL